MRPSAWDRNRWTGAHALHTASSGLPALFTGILEQRAFGTCYDVYVDFAQSAIAYGSSVVGANQVRAAVRILGQAEGATTVLAWYSFYPQTGSTPVDLITGANSGTRSILNPAGSSKYILQVSGVASMVWAFKLYLTQPTLVITIPITNLFVGGCVHGVEL
jgi:hypothetical protein